MSTKTELPEGLPPLPAGYKLAGQLRDHVGIIEGITYSPDYDEEWDKSSSIWAGEKGEPEQESSGWWIAIPAPATDWQARALELEKAGRSLAGCCERQMLSDEHTDGAFNEDMADALGRWNELTKQALSERGGV